MSLVAVGDLIIRIAVDVVGSQHQDNQLRLESIELSVLAFSTKPLRRISGDGKIAAFSTARSLRSDLQPGSLLPPRGQKNQSVMIAHKEEGQCLPFLQLRETLVARHTERPAATTLPALRSAASAALAPAGCAARGF